MHFGTAEMNPYEQAREERIKRNNAMLAQLELKQQVQAIAAPLAAAAEVDAKREAHMRAQLAAVQPRQRSTRSSATQAKKALTRQAAVLEADSADSGDNQSDVSDAEELSDESQGRGSARKRKAKDAVVAEEEDYDPLEDQLEAGNADSSASEAGDSGSNGSDFEMEEPRMAAKGKRQRRRPTGAADRRQRGNSRVGRPRPATPEPEQPGSEDDDFQLQQALAMSLLESRRGSVPASAQAGPSRASQAASADHSSELQQALAMSLQDRQAPAAREAAQAGASAAGQVGLSVVSEAPAGVKAEAPQGQPDTLVLQEEDIKPAEAVVKAEAEAMTATAAKVLPGSASLAITAAPSKAEVIQGKSAPSETATQPSSKRQPKAATGKQEARAQKSKKQPAKGKAIEIRDPDDVDKAFDMMAGNSTTIKEHLLQKVWADVRGGELDEVTSHNMLKYAADMAKQGQLDRQCFKMLCDHFSCS